jgi:hypothetical protein
VQLSKLQALQDAPAAVVTVVQWAHSSALVMPFVNNHSKLILKVISVY